MHLKGGWKLEKSPKLILLLKKNCSEQFKNSKKCSSVENNKQKKAKTQPKTKFLPILNCRNKKEKTEKLSNQRMN